jgi:hypothetical protein
MTTRADDLAPFSRRRVVDIAKIEDAISKGDRMEAMRLAYGEGSAAIIMGSERAGFSMFSQVSVLPVGTRAQESSLACTMVAAAATVSEKSEEKK